jgi:hypothetical protein
MPLPHRHTLRHLPCQLALQDHNYVSKIPPSSSPPPSPPLPLPLQPNKEQSAKKQCDLSLSCQPSSFEIEEILLPEEVWIIIWSYLDFNIVQKTCSRVSKSWLKMIRNSKLSWEMKLQIIYYKDDMDVIALRDFNSILFHWNNLRVLHFSSEQEFARFRLSLSLNSNESLKKIVIPAGPGLCTKGKGSNLDRTLWGVVTKYWIDPRHILAPDAVKNVVALKIYLDRLPNDFDMRQNDCDLTNLETLELCEYRETEMFWMPNTKLLSKFKNLKELVICLEIDIDFLLHIVRFLGNTNNFNISANVEVRSNYDKEDTKEIFNQALNILREKFPFPARRILDLKFFEDEDYYYGNEIEWRFGTKYSITYNESGATLTTSGDSSDSMDESVEYYDSFLESDENSDSMDESDEDSDSIDESDENSDDEDMNVQE